MIFFGMFLKVIRSKGQSRHFAKQQEAQMVRPKTAAWDVNEPRGNKRNKFPMEYMKLWNIYGIVSSI